MCFKPGNEDFVYASSGNEILSFDIRMGPQAKPLETYNYNRDEINQVICYKPLPNNFFILV
uniref:Uncharacterized protein n=1 Tax=Arundo donax TaxID=35708 RepID=A0A0A9DGP1_ARUDO